MSLGAIIVGTTLLLTAAATAYAVYMGLQGNKDQMGPQLEDFSPTMAKEGAAISIVYGKVRTPGNIIWWGNLETEEIQQEQKGGKGIGGGQPKQSSGYRTYVDCWQAVCFGKVEFEETYVNDKEQDIEASDIDTNDGTESGFPDVDDHVNRIPGVAHWFAEKWYLGDNVNSMPTVHFIVNRILETPVDYQNMSNGNNPAAIIYDLLLFAGVESGKIDLFAFNDAAGYWNSRGYGMNLKFDQQLDVARAIEQVLGYVDGVFYVTDEGKYAIRAIDPDASFLVEVDEIRMKDFSLNRKGWKQVANYFKANFIDEDQDYTQRTVGVDNPAAIRLARKKIPLSLDLKCFRDLTTASNRLWEVLKRESYPTATIKFKYDMTIASMLPGDVIRVSHADYGIVSADFRIEEIDSASIDKNEISIKARQQSETLFDDNFLPAGGTNWTDPELEPVPLTHVEILELPYQSRTEFEPAFLILAQREQLSETNFFVYTSNQSGGDYVLSGDFTTFAMRGTLDTEYTGDTRKIDDLAGVIFTPYKEDPDFTSISRAQLFNVPRIAIIENEIVAFHGVVPLGGGSYQLTGIIRGILETDQATHAAGSEIWLAYIGNNVLENVPWNDFYFKVVPQFLDRTADISAVSPVNYSVQHKALFPWQVGRIEATRAGANIDVQLWTRTPGFPGAGVDPESVSDQAPPFQFGGDFRINHGATQFISSVDSFLITEPATVDVTARARLNGYESAPLTVQVLAFDGVYKS